jgi:TRAP-type mannitol/chloroaromatic compound transport system substrate-binding protein
LPEEYQAAVENAAKAANIGTMAKYDVLNSEALAQVKAVAEIREFPEDVLIAFKTDFETVLDDVASTDGRFADILGPWRAFRDSVHEWHGLAESSMLRAFLL